MTPLHSSDSYSTHPLFLQHLAWHKKITIFRTGTAPILIVPCIRGLRDICIPVTATKTCWDNWLNLWTVYIHVHTMYRHVHMLYMSTTLKVPPRCIRACTAFLIVINNAMVQEFAHLYMHFHAVYIPPKNGSGRWSAFLWHFHIFMYRHQ
jgi:hypothetical protein